jgi:hypothetical protein
MSVTPSNKDKKSGRFTSRFAKATVAVALTVGGGAGMAAQYLVPEYNKAVDDMNARLTSCFTNVAGTVYYDLREHDWDISEETVGCKGFELFPMPQTRNPEIREKAEQCFKRAQNKNGSGVTIFYPATPWRESYCRPRREMPDQLLKRADDCTRIQAAEDEQLKFFTRTWDCVDINARFAVFI